MILQRLFFAAVCIFFCTAVFAQKAPMRFGNPSNKEVLSEKDEKYPDAEAVVLCDYGKTFFSFGNKYLEIRHIHESRIKIQTKDGYDHAEVEIPFYSVIVDGERIEEDVIGVKGFTYNAKDGSVEKFKLDKSDIFIEKKTDDVSLVKFTLPNVKPGSVIEYKYEIRTPRFMLWLFRGWQFQRSIPTRWSEFRAEYLQATIFSRSSRGYQDFIINEGPTRGVAQGSDLYVFAHRWAVKDAPGMRPDEDYVASPRDYLTQIDFRLTKVQFPGQEAKTFSQTWQEMSGDLLKSKGFGGFLKNDTYFSELATKITEGSSSKEEQISMIHSDLCSHVDPELSGGYTKMDSKQLEEDYEKKKLSASEANMILVRMLKALDYESEPVLVSTRSHGKINISSPNASDFNYVLCSYKTTDGFLFLDAADTLLPSNMVSPRCLNGKAFMVASSPGHVNVNASTSAKESAVINIKLDENQQIKANVEFSLDGYAAYKMRKELEEKQAKEVLEEEYDDEESKSEIEVESVSNLNNADKPFIIKYNTTFTDAAMSAGGRVYVSPLLAYAFKENPFKLEERKFPIDMPYPVKETYVVKLDIPEGYEVEEIPQAQSVALPEGAGRFTYSASMAGNQVQVMSRMSIKKTYFLPEYYPMIKEFFARVVEKQNEQIVLKKKD